MREFKLYSDGQWVESGAGTIVDDLNPATGEVFARVHHASVEDVDRAIAAAQRASEQWGTSLPAEREKILMNAADLLEQRTSEFVDVLIDEAGATFGKAMAETSFVVNLLRSAAGEARRITGETMPSDSPGLISMSVRRPLGVIGGISPFNFPFLLAAKKVVLAIAAGNTFVLKPASDTAVIGLKIGELLGDAGLPAGVVNVVPGSGAAVGNQLVTDPRISMLTFTGSTEIGKQLAVEAAKTLKKITLELGGKSPIIVLDDADIAYAVDAACFGVFLNQGQVCMANSRIICEAGIFDEFCDRFTAKVATLKVGNPREHDTVIGPLIKPSQCRFLDSHVRDAVDKGAKLLTGGSSEGAFYAPTVLAGVTPDMVVYHEESFGPVVSIIAVQDHEEALTVANDTCYGLSSAVITNDLQKAMKLALGLEAGMVHVNGSSAYDEPHVPFGGIKDSGMGREGGRYSMEEMTEVKWLTIQMGQRHFPF